VIAIAASRIALGDLPGRASGRETSPVSGLPGMKRPVDPYPAALPRKAHVVARLSEMWRRAITPGRVLPPPRQAVGIVIEPLRERFGNPRPRRPAPWSRRKPTAEPSWKVKIKII
jgi:hypothetical protein